MIQAWAQFHFLRPYWLLVFIPLLLVLWQTARRSAGNHNWEAFCDAALLPHILSGGMAARRRLVLLWMAVAGTLAILALAGPAWKRIPQPVFSNQAALVIALDLSRSMDADDITPSRLLRARFKISDILAGRPDGQTALLVYAGDAFVVTPLTDDIVTIRSQLAALGTDIMPAPGNRTDLALHKAQQLLVQAGMAQGNILLITDGIADQADYELAAATLARLRPRGYIVSVLGVGTAHGVPVPLADGSFLKGKDGEIIIPALDAPALRQLAALGGGIYRSVAKNDSDVDALLAYFQRDTNRQADGGAAMQTDAWQEQGPWLLLLLLPLVAMSFRKGYLFILALVLLPMPDTATALGWHDLWLNAEQQGQRAMQAEQYHEALRLFADKRRKAAAAYRAGDYAAALENLQGAADADDAYNKGNAYARLGRYAEAIAAYDETLAQQPDHADAQYNKALVEQAMQQQEQESEQQQRDSPEQQQDGSAQPRAAGQDKDQAQDQNPGRQDQQQAQRQDDQQSSADDGNAKEDLPADDNQQENKQVQPEVNQDKARQPAQAEGAPAAEQQDAQAMQAGFAPDADINVDEDQQATEQWLRRIPDDPAGLLRRKFKHQYGRRQAGPRR